VRPEPVIPRPEITLSPRGGLAMRIVERDSTPHAA
jgi:hypothetical protein